MGLPLPDLDAISGEECDIPPQSLPDKLEASVGDAMDLHWSLVRAGKRLMRVVEREDSFRELRRPGAMQVLISARMSADKLMDSQLRVDEAKLRAATSENVVAKILEKLAEHDQAR